MHEIRAEIRREHGMAPEDTGAELANASALGNDGELDVKQIMREIRASIKTASTEPVPPFNAMQGVPQAVVPIGQPVQYTGPNSAIETQIANEAQYLKGSHYISYYWDYGRGPKAFIKKIVRKLNRSILLPINEKQNDFNLHAANGVDALRIGMEYQQSQIGGLHAALQQLGGIQAMVENIREQVEGQWSAIEVMQEQMNRIEAESALQSDNKMSDRLRKMETQMKKQRQEQFALEDSLRALQDGLEEYKTKIR